MKSGIYRQDSREESLRKRLESYGFPGRPAKPPTKEDKVKKVMEKYKEGVDEDKELRMWVVEKVLTFHKSETDTSRLEKDMRLVYNFITDESKRIPDNISYV